MRVLLCLLTLVWLPSLSFHADAVDIEVNVTGEIYIPPCVINDNSPIIVRFSDMLTVDVDGQNNAETIYCYAYSGAPYIKLTGSPLSNAPTNVLRTTISYLGIALYMGDSVDNSYPMTLGTGDIGYGYTVTAGLDLLNSGIGVFTFTAVLFTSDVERLQSGPFSASALMSLVYL